MILEKTKNTSEVMGGAVKIGSFNLKGENFAKIFELLRGGIYSNPILAVIREYSTNAYDAHVAAGKQEIPIEVILPTSESLIFSVRDFGTGLSEQRIIEVFCSYGQSEKDNSNEFTGMLGIGSKSGHAYGDSFMVISRFEGVKSIYNMTIGEDNIGDIIILSRENSTEESGLEIIIPVSHADIDKFYNESLNLFKYFKTTPKINNANGDEIQCQSYHSGASKAAYKGDGWEFWNNSFVKPTIVMGNIPYPVDHKHLKGKVDEFTESILEDCGIVIHSNIGDITFSNSRESLRYSKKTIDFIIAKSNAISSSLSDKIEADIQSVNNLNELANYYNQSVRHNKAFRAACKSKQWRGFKLGMKFSVPESNLFEVKIHNGDSWVKIPVDFQVDFERSTVFVVNDLSTQEFTSRAIHYTGYQVFKIEMAEGETIDKFLEVFPINKILKGSELPRPIKKYSSRSGSNYSIYKEKLIVYEYNDAHRKSASWRAVKETDLESKYKFYVPSLYMYAPEFCQIGHLNYFKKIYATHFQVNIDDIIIFASKGLLKNEDLPDDCINLKDFIENIKTTQRNSFNRYYILDNCESSFRINFFSRYKDILKNKTLIQDYILELEKEIQFVKDYKDNNKFEISIMESFSSTHNIRDDVYRNPLKRACDEVFNNFPILYMFNTYMDNAGMESDLEKAMKAVFI